MNERDVNGCSFIHQTLTLLLHYLVKCKSRTLVFYNIECILVAYASAQKIIARPQNHWKSAVTRSTTSCGWSVLCKQVYRTKISNVNELKDASTASGPLWVMRLLNMLSVSGVSVYALAFVLEADTY